MQVDKSELERLYVTQGLTIKEISRLYKVSLYTVHRLLKKFGIVTRRRGPRGPYGRVPPESELRKLYSDQKLSLRQVGKSYGVSYVTVHKWMSRYNIERRPSCGRPRKVDLPKEELSRLLYVEKRTVKQIAEILNVSDPTIRGRIKEYGMSLESQTERLDKTLTKEKLEDYYHKLNYSAQKIGEIFGVSYRTIRTRLKRFGIATKRELRATGPKRAAPEPSASARKSGAGPVMISLPAVLNTEISQYIRKAAMSKKDFIIEAVLEKLARGGTERPSKLYGRIRGEVKTLTGAVLPLKLRARIREEARQLGISQNEFIVRACSEKTERLKGEPADESHIEQLKRLREELVLL